jgi:hypothetical protein
MKIVRESLNESLAALNEGVVVSPKDWDRMLDLVLKGDDGETAAKLIKDKNKAIARFVAGLKLSNAPFTYDPNNRWRPFGSVPFEDLGKKAMEMGATADEIQSVFDATEVPQSVIEKQTQRAGKKLIDRFVGAISKSILDAGADITFLPHNGYAITGEGRDAMDRNGRKWTIGYKSEITLPNGTKLPFNFDAITDEGDGPTSYVIDHTSDSIFRRYISRERIGKNELIASLRTIFVLNDKT